MGSMQEEMEKVTGQKKREDRSVPVTEDIKLLEETRGPAETARLLGLTGGGYYSMRTRDRCSQTVARLARYVVQEMQGDAVMDRRRLLVCRVPKSEMETVRKVVTSLGGKALDMGDE